MSESPFDPPSSNPGAAPTTSATSKSSAGRPWALMIQALVLIALWGVPPVLRQVAPDSISQFFFSAIILPAICLLVVIGTWIFGKAIPAKQRLGVLGLLAVILVAMIFLVHKSLGGMAIVMYGTPAIVTALCLWLIVSKALKPPVRSAGVVALSVLVAFAFCLLRVHGVTGSFAAEFDWRWNPNSEERMIASKASATDSSGAKSTEDATAKVDDHIPVSLTLQPGDWAEFRGSNRDGVVRSLRVAEDWKASPPKEVWRSAIGPGWSSFCVVGGYVFTQQQLGTEDQVICLDAATGKQVWVHSESSRFEEPVAGAGPRGTPTFADGKLYVQCAAGAVICLDATNGKLRWKLDLCKDFGVTPPEWGFSASPLVHNGQVTVYSGADGKAVVSLNAETGETVWASGNGTKSYCSAQLSKLGGTEQLLFSTDVGLQSFDPVSGKMLWQHEWKTEGIARIVQPLVLDNGDILIGTGLGVGLRRIHVEQSDGQWRATEVWTTKRCKPYFNDSVVYGDHLYAIDGAVFMCVDLKNGEVIWRARGYGSGQVLLLVDQGLLLIVTETGDIALVRASPEKHQEIARLKAIEGKTWNHPVIAQNRLYIRNGAEAVCYELAAEANGQP